MFIPGLERLLKDGTVCEKVTVRCWVLRLKSPAQCEKLTAWMTAFRLVVPVGPADLKLNTEGRVPVVAGQVVKVATT